MRRSRAENERLNRLASEAVCTVCHTLIAFDNEGNQRCECGKRQAPKGGGGLALSLFFSTILNELLDNGPADDARLAEIVADRGANKTKKLTETWNGSWEFLTTDLMDQLAAQGYAERNGDDRWHIGEKFVPGISLETIPARPGQNSAGHTTVWPKEEREALSRAKRIEVVKGQFIQQPRGRTHAPDIVNELRASLERFGPLQPVLKDAHGRTLDGRHRSEIDPDWPTFTLDFITTDDQAVDAIIEIDHWHKKGYEKLSDGAVEKIKAICGEAVPTQNEIKRSRVEAELLRDAARSDRAIAELVGVTAPTVGDERAKLEREKFLHVYFSQGSGGGSKTKHSTECWCGEGDYEPKTSKAPKEPKEPKGPTAKEKIFDALRAWIVQRQNQGKSPMVSTAERPELVTFVQAHSGLQRGTSHGSLIPKIELLLAQTGFVPTEVLEPKDAEESEPEPVAEEGPVKEAQPPVCICVPNPDCAVHGNHVG